MQKRYKREMKIKSKRSEVKITYLGYIKVLMNAERLYIICVYMYAKCVLSIEEKKSRSAWQMRKKNEGEFKMYKKIDNHFSRSRCRCTYTMYTPWSHWRHTSPKCSHCEFTFCTLLTPKKKLWLLRLALFFFCKEKFIHWIF